MCCVNVIICIANAVAACDYVDKSAAHHVHRAFQTIRSASTAIMAHSFQLEQTMALVTHSRPLDDTKSVILIGTLCDSAHTHTNTYTICEQHSPAHDATEKRVITMLRLLTANVQRRCAILHILADTL